MEIGKPVIYVDEVAKEHHAIVNSMFAHGPDYPEGHQPSVNLVFVVGDDSKTDQYGRQIDRATSVVHQSQQSAHGRYWYVKE